MGGVRADVGSVGKFRVAGLSGRKLAPDDPIRTMLRMGLRYKRSPADSEPAMNAPELRAGAGFHILKLRQCRTCCPGPPAFPGRAASPRPC